MSKISNSLKMLFYLNGKENYSKIGDIADHLEVGKREVRRYRDDLEMAGFYIENLTGPNGGYKLIEKLDLSLGLSQFETLLLNLNVRNNQNIFKSLNKTIAMISKLKQNLIIGDNFIDDETLYKLCTIQEAKEQNKKVKINYLSFRYGEGTYEAEPYFFKIERNQYYLFAYHRNKIKMYKVSNILSITKLEEEYSINQDLYDAEIADDSFGVFRGGNTFEVLIEVTGKINNYIDDFFNDKIELTKDEGNTKQYKLKTHNLREVLTTILSLGSSVKIISPTELKEMYANEVKKMANNL